MYVIHGPPVLSTLGARANVDVLSCDPQDLLPPSPDEPWLWPAAVPTAAHASGGAAGPRTKAGLARQRSHEERKRRAAAELSRARAVDQGARAEAELGPPSKPFALSSFCSRTTP